MTWKVFLLFDTSVTFPALYRSKNQKKKKLQYKKTGGKMMLMFVPEVATGRYQVNDTHWHQPLKDEARALAQRGIKRE